MRKDEEKLELGPEPEKIEIIETEKEKKVMVMGKLYLNWPKRDEVAPKVAIAQLYCAGHAKPEALARIFKLHINSVYNYIAAYKENGIKGLIEQIRGPKESWKVTPDIRCQILYSVIKEGKREYKEIQELVEKRTKKKISLGSIWQVLSENGFIKEKNNTSEMKTGQGELFEEMGSEELALNFFGKEVSNYEERYFGGAEVELQKDTLIFKKEETNSVADKNTSAYSRSERVYLDGLEQGFYSLYAGGLFFVPMLKRYLFLETIKRVFKKESREEEYNLERICLTLFYFDVFGFSSIENFKTVYPEEYGILIGKLKSPGIRTLRRYLHEVRKLKISEQLIDEFAKEYLKAGLVKWGVLYIDEHFLPYYGMKIITLGWFTIRDRVLKGSYNFIANDAEYNPLLFLIRPSSEDLLEKIPEIVTKARKLAEAAGIDGKDLTIIFDREGYCAELFRRLDGEKGEPKVKFISWAKYADDWVHDFEEKKFEKEVTVKYEIETEDLIKYFETERQMSKYGKIRAIVIESGRNKKRMAIYTNAGKETEAGLIIQLICRRWGQENLIKILKLRHLIDYHPGYIWEELEEQPLVDNPELLELKQRRANLKTQLHGLELKLIEKMLKEKDEEINLKEIKKREIDTFADIRGIESQITILNQKMDELPKEKRFDEVHEALKLGELDYEKKRFLDCIKVFAYHLGKKMCEILEKYYEIQNVKKEIWPALIMIIKRGAYVKLEHGKLTVRLKRLKNPEIDYAARHLCEELNQMAPSTLDKFHFPIHYKVG